MLVSDRHTLVDGSLVLGVALDVLGEPLVELVVGVEQCGHDEVEQGPQLWGKKQHVSMSAPHTHTLTHTHSHTPPHLSHGVLDGCTSQQQSVSTLELEQDLPAHAADTHTHSVNICDHTPAVRAAASEQPWRCGRETGRVMEERPRAGRDMGVWHRAGRDAEGGPRGLRDVVAGPRAMARVVA